MFTKLTSLASSRCFPRAAAVSAAAFPVCWNDLRAVTTLGGSTRWKHTTGTDGTSDLIDELMEENKILYDGWKYGSPGAMLGTQTSHVETDATGTVVSIAPLHRKDHDPYGNHKQPHLIDLIYTSAHARRNGHCVSLLKRLVGRKRDDSVCRRRGGRGSLP
jgi:hypothetical protein